MTEYAIQERGSRAGRARGEAEVSSDGATQSEVAAQLIRDDILSGALPPGEKLRFHVLRARYATGVGPLREALVRLQEEQLVEWEGRRGFWVAPVSADEIRDLTRMRVLLEGEALKRSIEQGGDAWEAELVSTYHRLARCTGRGAHLSADTMQEWETAHEGFHRALIAGDASRLLSRLRSRLTMLVMRYRRLALIAAGDRDHLGEHKSIMEAALAHDAEAAIRLLTEHYDHTTQAILAAMEPKDV